MRPTRYIYLRNITVMVLAVLTLAACNADKHLKKGEQYWAIGEYYEASLEYAKAYSKTPPSQKDKRGMIAYKVAESNRRMNYYAKAQAAYRNAVRYNYTDTLTYFSLPEMERINKEYKLAARDYQLYLDSHPKHNLSKVGLESCTLAPEMKEKGSAYTVKEDKNFKSTYMDYAPSFCGEDIYFSSTRRDCNGDDVNGITGMKSGDIFFMQKDDKGKWKRYEQVDETVNSKYDEGACAFSPDGKTMYFTRCRVDATYPRFAEIFASQRSDASWGEAKMCEISKDTLSSYAHPAITPNGNYMYFVSDMPGGYGGLDLWRCTVSGTTFGPVENLGSDINTEGDEMFPTFRPNGDLYFSSNGRPGMGGLDIYKATLDSAANRWEVSHLPSPVNSNGDDFGMTFSGDLNQGYFSSHRANRRGGEKIYSFYCPEIVQTVKGWVYEQDGYELPQAVVYIVGDDGTNKKATIQLDGSFEETVQPGVRYLFLATCEGYMNYKQELAVEPVEQSEEYVLQFPLPSLDIPVLVRNVFYEFDKANITPQSIPALEGLIGLLQQNPSIAIELSSHCDYRGSDEYNERLSQARAESVVNYLTTHGIESDRVVAKGYGENKPKVITKKFAERYPFLNPGDTLTEEYIKTYSEEPQDTCNALNRRTEFSVLKTTYGLLDNSGNLNAEAAKNEPSDTIVRGGQGPVEEPKAAPAAKQDSTSSKPMTLDTKSTPKDSTATKPTAAQTTAAAKDSTATKVTENQALTTDTTAVAATDTTTTAKASTAEAAAGDSTTTTKTTTPAAKTTTTSKTTTTTSKKVTTARKPRVTTVTKKK